MLTFFLCIRESPKSKLNFSTIFHLQTKGQPERMIQTLKEILRFYVLEFKGSWEKYLPLVKFAYNNSYQASIQMPPYEALYNRKYRTPLCWTELNKANLVGLEMIQEAKEKVKFICEDLKEALDCQKSYADLSRKEIEFQVGEKVFLKVSPWKKVLYFGKKGNLTS